MRERETRRASDDKRQRERESGPGPMSNLRGFRAQMQHRFDIGACGLAWVGRPARLSAASRKAASRETASTKVVLAKAVLTEAASTRQTKF